VRQESPQRRRDENSSPAVPTATEATVTNFKILEE
jgi:hypothetical protein